MKRQLRGGLVIAWGLWGWRKLHVAHIERRIAGDPSVQKSTSRILSCSVSISLSEGLAGAGRSSCQRHWIRMFVAVKALSSSPFIYLPHMSPNTCITDK